MDAGSAEAFAELGTLGVEEEFYVVDERGRPTSGTDEMVYESEPPPLLADRLDHELFKCIVETQTPTMASLEEVRETVPAVRAALVEYAAEFDLGIAVAGLHPAARWRELEHADKPRYRSQLDRIQYPQHRNTTAGLHVHVGVDDGDKAVWIANEIRWYLPVLLAVSANSPYWNGFDTGLQSARAKIFEGLPNTGMPTAFAGIDEYLTLERRLLSTGAIEDRGEIWYDVRPHTEHGTVEVRTPDAQHDPDDVLAFVEFVRALVLAAAERYESLADPFARYRGPGLGGEAHLRRELLDENKWRATRHGRDATLIRRDGDGTVPLAEAVESACDRLGVDGLRRVLDRGSGAERQRRVRESGGLDALCADLLLEP